MDAYRELIRENIDYEGFVRGRPYDVSQLDEMIELMMEAVCSKKKNLRVAGNDFPQEAGLRTHPICVRLPPGEHPQVRNMKQYLLTVLYNAPATIENHYATQVNHNLYDREAA